MVQVTASTEFFYKVLPFRSCLIYPFSAIAPLPYKRILRGDEKRGFFLRFKDYLINPPL